jgi:hypothetical protein
MSYGKRIRYAAKILFETCTKGGTVATPTVPPIPAPPAPPVVLAKDIKIAIFNESSVMTDGQLEAIVGALQKQVSGDFAPVWGVDAELTYFPKGATVDPTMWQLGIFDNSDQAGALGYHDITAAGLPLGKVFAATDIQYSSSPSVTLSHECLEMLGDPDINLSVFVQQTDTSGTIYAYETADAVEDDSLGYQIDGILLSDFVYPSWFESFRTAGPYDKQGKVTAPFELLPGGYIGVYQIPNSQGWTQLNADKVRSMRYENRPRLGSRRDRRQTPRESWVRSAK